MLVKNQRLSLYGRLGVYPPRGWLFEQIRKPELAYERKRKRIRPMSG